MRKDNSISALSMLTSLEECKGSNEEKFKSLLQALTRVKMDQLLKCELTHKFTKKHFGRDLEAFGDLLMAHQHLFATKTLQSVIKGYVFSLLTERWFIYEFTVDIEKARKILELVFWLRHAFGPDEIGTFNRLLRDVGFSFNGLDSADMMTIFQEVDAKDPANASILAEGWLKSQGSLEVAMHYLQTRCETESESNVEETQGILKELTRIYPPLPEDKDKIAHFTRLLIQQMGPNEAFHWLYASINPRFLPEQTLN